MTRRLALSVAITLASFARLSAQPIAVGPKLRALSLKSDIGDIAAVNADNNMGGPGAVWDLSGVIGDGRLDPD